MSSLLSETEIQQLCQLTIVTWDGDLISKEARTELFIRGLVHRLEGWNWLTLSGVKVLIDAGFLNA